ncbi:AAA family ATPase [Streptomyces ureilyticus]|uniref:MoxR family ATPase n=1 Tax=Streptomyces ureilyticus TaxID=1775131 RepID=A0ABX0E8Y4_9ACTN|nr:MoxR family ATPase [Streptomyces ureilyticus]NGO49493.1 MoxR family ATPase [Streptomyces ureilyticus]
MTSASQTPAWWVYRGDGIPHNAIERLPDPPSWRPLQRGMPPQDGISSSPGPADTERGRVFQADRELVDVVNAALLLRRPLLLTGRPGTGKSTLAHAVAYELGLGPVLHWPVTSRTTLRDGLYEYDAIGRLHEANLQRAGMKAGTSDIGRYLQLGPLGTALLPRRRPRVLLIDELDKSDIDLPNDLLTVFEEGRFSIRELLRLPSDQQSVLVQTADGGQERVTDGQVSCWAFPFVVITSNEEREFPAAFARRCLRYDIEPPGPDRLAAIVAAHLGADAYEQARPLVEAFLGQRENGDVAVDQLLSAIHLARAGADEDPAQWQDLLWTVWRHLETGP